jgi:hypothetical protein
MMAKKKYLVTAECKNDRCPTKSFQKIRKSMTYLGSDDNEYVIRKLVCPSCGMHAGVTKIESIEPGKKVA